MTAESPTIRLERYSERHVEGLTALYNDPAVARQVLQMPYQSVEQRRKRLHDSADDDLGRRNRWGDGDMRRNGRGFPGRRRVARMQAGMRPARDAKANRGSGDRCGY